RVRMDGQVRLDEAYPLDLTVDWHFEQAPALSLTGNGQVTGDLAALQIEHRLSGAVEARLRAQVDEALKTPHWQAEVDLESIALSQLVPEAPPIDLQARLQSTGRLDDYSYRIDAQAHGEHLPEAELALAGSGDRHHTDLRELKIDTLNGLISGQGEVDWSPALTWDLALTASDLDPGRYAAGLEGRLGLTAETAGGLESGFDFRLNAETALADYPPTRLDLAGSGTTSEARFETLAIEVIDGRIEGSGTLSWSPRPRWEADLTLAELDPGQLLADWPGRLGGRLQSQGELTADGLDLGARLDEFGGELRGYPVTLQADLGMQGETLSLRTLQAASGETRFVADGRVGERLDLRYRLDSPNLAALLPDLQGRLEAEGTLVGTRAQPRATLTLTGRGIELDGQGIARLDATADVGLAPESPFRLTLEGDTLILGGQRFERLQARGQGSTGSHRLNAEINGEPLSLALALEAGLDNRRAYRGRLTRLALASREYGDWGLERAAPFSLAAGAVEAGPLCLGNGGSSSGCIGFRQPEAGRVSVALDLQRLDFELLDALTPETTSINGYLTARADIEAEGDRLAGSAELRVPEGGVEIVLAKASETLVFSGTRLDVRAGDAGVDARFELPIDGAGRIDAEVGLPGFRLGALERQALNGRLRIALDGLDRFAALAPEVSDTEGRIDGDLGLGGRLTQPRINGNLAARDLALSVPVLGLRVEDLDLTAASEGGDAIRLDGGALVGGGQLDVDGQATDISAGQPNLSVQLTGQDLKVADSKEYMAVVSLDLEAGFGPDGGAVRGELSVPKATIMPRTIPAGAVQPSPDVVLEEKTDNGGVPIGIDVLAELGDEVLIEAFGLQGRLQGQLRVTQEPGKPLLGNGELEVIDGTYRVSLPGLGLLTSVGPPLAIKKGIVLFASTPLDNPGIILDAQREGGDLSAGVRVLGTLRHPKLAFFSESDPNMSQSEITRYLVTGIPPRRDGETDDRSLSVGTYIAPKLFMEYDSSLGDQSDRIKMRYDLTKRLQLQSETGDAQGVDIFYKFEN
ncbi:MAG: translocation/assembly module TamB domain-containing protein, partial [Halochromatium sp.]|uniref:translocation/assembly module TamB domain-containing protein n=1 Tax=Halochromatium sp. TaxID=2049430 RepID=UPI00397C354F